jgi:3,5-epimerase/4-reductase
MKILIVGQGYIGTRCKDEWGDEAILSDRKLYSKQDVLDLLEEINPDVVLNAAGVRGKPNVDWCETHQYETMEGNVNLPINIAEACHERNIYLLHIGSGCVFYGESPDPAGWLEEDFANPIAYYSKCKYAADLSLGSLPNVGVARIRVPLDDRPYPGNIIDKLAVYPKIIDVENSITVIPDMIEVFHQLLEKKAEGIFHVTNPGALKYRSLMELYREMVDPTQTNEWITEEDLVSQGLTAKLRSTNKLQSKNLEKYGIHMKPIEESVRAAMENYAQAKKN